jgi:hypothetical protein
MDTVSELVGARIENFRKLLRTFVLEQPGEMRDINDDPQGLVFIGANYAWPELDHAGHRLQSRLLTENSELAPLVGVLLSGIPSAAEKDVRLGQDGISEVIDQSHLCWHSSRQEAWASVEEALDMQIELLNRLYDPTEGAVILMPDTNALLWNPDIEQWRFPDLESFELVITATVLSEIDRLKTEHRNEDVRSKATGIVNRLKSYRQRGRLADGVPLTTPVSTIRTLAIEPDFEDNLPWLDSSHADDRILASLVEVMRTHTRSAVALVTRDINLQNKAEFASLPFLEVPDPRPR